MEDDKEVKKPGESAEEAKKPVELSDADIEKVSGGAVDAYLYIDGIR